MRPGARWLWAVAALAVPLAARGYLAHRVSHALEPALGRLVGRAVTVGGVEADLSGALRLDRVAIAGVGEAETIEAGFGPGDVLAGRLAPAEVEVSRPRLVLELDGRGHSNLEPILARVARRIGRTARSGPGAAPAPGSRRPGALERVVVRDGDLTVDLGRLGRLTAGGVELIPYRGRLRIRSGPVELTLAASPWRARARFPRAALDLSLPSLTPLRLLAVGGAGSIESARADRAGRADLTRAVLSAGLDGPIARLGGQFAGADPHARIDVTLARSADGGRLTAGVALSHAPLAALAPALPRWVRLAGARASGHATVHLPGSPAAGASGAVDFTARATLSGLALADPRLGARPVALGGQLTARGSLATVAGRRLVVLDRATLRRGGAVLDLSGRGEWRAGSALPERAELSARLPDTDCGAALAAIPPGLRHALAGLELDGRVAGSAALAFDRRDPSLTHLAVDVDLDGCRARAEPALADPSSLRAPFDHVFPDGHRARVGKGPGYSPLSAMPAYLPGAFIAAEDARFYHHHGFDLEQIERSLAVDLAEGHVVRGGSTISQQLVKNAFLGPQRTFTRKLEEAVLTWRLEDRLPKRVILERYLNLIELGDGHVFGVAAAARRWFGVTPSSLTVRQAAFLAALTPAPHTLSRRLAHQTHPDDDMNQRIDVVLRAMRRSGIISQAVYRKALAEPLALTGSALARVP